MEVWGSEAALRVRQGHTADVVADVRKPKFGTKSVTSNIRKAMLVYPDISMSSKLPSCTIAALYSKAKATSSYFRI